MIPVTPNFPSIREGDPVSAELLRMIVAEIRRISNLSVVPPLLLNDSAGGRQLRLDSNLPGGIITNVTIPGGDSLEIQSNATLLADIGSNSTIAGSLSYTPISVSLSANQNNYSITCVWLRINATAALTITGFSFSVVANAYFEITNTGTATITLPHHSGSSTYPISTPDGRTDYIQPGETKAFKFDGTYCTIVQQRISNAQTGSANPTHTAPTGTVFVNATSGTAYVNTSALPGGNTWQLATASGGGTVTSVGATAPVTSSGGSTPTIGISPPETSDSTASRTISSSDGSSVGGKLFRTNGGAMADTLPSPPTPPWSTTIINTGGGTDTITPTSGTINGGSSYTIPVHTAATFESDGTNFTVSSISTGGSTSGGSSGGTDHSAQISVSSGTITAGGPFFVSTTITFGSTPVYDTDGYFSSGSPTILTIPAGLGGKYLIVATIVCHENTGPITYGKGLRIIVPGIEQDVPASNPFGDFQYNATASGIVKLVAGATVSLTIGSLHPNALTITSAVLTIQKIDKAG